MRRIGLLAFTLTSVAALTFANAADMYRAPEPSAGGYKDVPVASWTGFYAGINGGGAWSAGNNKLTASAFDNDAPPAPFSASSQAGLDSSGGFGGGQIGYNWQGTWHPRVVLGVEADFQGAGIDGRAKTRVEADPAEAAMSPGGTDVPSTVDARSRLDWFGTARGRLGYAFDRTLVYATGGFAFGHTDDRLTGSTDFGRGPIPFSAKSSDTRTGFTVGGGLEYSITPAFSLKAEYQFIDLGSSTLASGASISQFNTETASGSAKIDHSYNTVRAGLNYHIAPAYEPLK